MQILPSIQSRFEQALVGLVDQPVEHAKRVTLARDPQHGDYQANIAMPLAKQLGKKPLDIAADILSRLEISDLCEAPEIAGPGFINLRIKSDYLAEQLMRVAVDERLTVGTGQTRTYVIDYSAPNVAKPMHVGHIRSTVIGDALARILRFLGNQVISDNHLGDWGTQFGMIIYGYKHFVDQAAFAQEPVAELSRIYRIVQNLIGYQSAKAKLEKAAESVAIAKQKAAEAEAAAKANPKQAKAAKAAAKSAASATAAWEEMQAKVDAVEGDPVLSSLAETHTELETKAQQETVKLHEGDEENLGLWKKFLPISIEEIETVYQRLGVKFDYTLGESFYHPMLADVVEGLAKKGMAVESDGATCVFLDGFDAPMIIRKRDGAFLYATTDLATVQYRMEQFKPDAVLYVVDHRQGEHFQKLFVAARAMGYTDVELQHISFGTVLGNDGKPFKTRSGDVVGLNYLLDEAVQRAHQVVCDPERLEKSGIDFSEEERRTVAETVGLGAIKYADLSHNRTSDYKFNIDEMVQLEGDTAAYIQYMYARSRSIIRRSEVELDCDNCAQFPILLQQPAERTLALQLLQFEDALLQSTEEYYPSVLAGYLFGVAKQFATFFDQCHVLNAESEELKHSRLVICHTVGRVLERGLSLLGIGVVERM